VLLGPPCGSCKPGPVTSPRKGSHVATGELPGSARDQGKGKASAANASDWEVYDPAWLARLAAVQQPEATWLADALGACTRVRVRSAAMIHFVDPHGPEWDFDTNIVLESDSHGDLVLDVLTGQRIGGVEFLSRR